MPGNVDPIYGKVYKNPRVSLATGYTTYDGTNASLLFTADATNGSKLMRLIVQPKGTNVASLLRIYKASGSTNFALIREFALAATTASNTSAAFPIEIPFVLGLEASAQIYVHLTVTVAGGYDIMAEAMDY